MIDNNRLKTLRPLEKRNYIEKELFFTRIRLKKISKNIMIALICGFALLSSGLIASLSPGNLTAGIITLGISTIPGYAIYSNLKKEKATLYEMDELIKIKRELERTELNIKENTEEVKKSNNIVLSNSINHEFKISEIERKLLYLNKEEKKLKRKKELLVLFKNNINDFNRMYERNELFEYLYLKGYNNEEIKYLLNEINDIKMSEKAYMMKLNNWQRIIFNIYLCSNKRRRYP